MRVHPPVYTPISESDIRVKTVYKVMLNESGGEYEPFQTRLQCCGEIKRRCSQCHLRQRGNYPVDKFDQSKGQVYVLKCFIPNCSVSFHCYPIPTISGDGTITYLWLPKEKVDVDFRQIQHDTEESLGTNTRTNWKQIFEQYWQEQAKQPKGRFTAAAMISAIHGQPFRYGCSEDLGQQLTSENNRLFNSFKTAARNFVKGKDNNGMTLATIGDVRKFAAENSLVIPTDWNIDEKRDNFTAKDIRAVFGFSANGSSNYRCLPVDEEVVNTIAELLSRNKEPPMTEEDRVKLAQVTVFVSAGTIKNLYDFVHNYRPGMRCGFVDGTWNLINDASVLLIFASLDVQYRIGTARVTGSLRPFLLVEGPSEHRLVLLCALVLCRIWSRRLFNKDFILDYGESDFAGGFMKAYQLFGCLLLLNCFFHVVKEMKGKSRTKMARIRTGYSKDDERPSGSIVTKLIDKDAHAVLLLTMVRCIHKCTTPKAAARASELCVECLRELGEHSAADHLIQYYFCNNRFRWYVGASLCPGIHPTGNPNESLNKVVKQIIPLNVARERFYGQSLPEVFERIDQHHTGCKISLPSEIPVSSVNAIICLCMSASLDMRSTGLVAAEHETELTSQVQYYVNAGATVGHPITEARVNHYEQTLIGESRRSEDTVNLSGVEKFFLFFNDHTQFCKVRQREDSQWVCSCESFMKTLQCSGSAFVMDQERNEADLDNIGIFFRSALVKKRGRPRHKNLSGLNKGLGTKKEPTLTAKDLIRRLTEKQINEVGRRLGHHSPAVSYGMQQQQIQEEVAKRMEGSTPNPDDLTLHNGLLAGADLRERDYGDDDCEDEVLVHDDVIQSSSCGGETILRLVLCHNFTNTGTVTRTAGENATIGSETKAADAIVQSTAQKRNPRTNEETRVTKRSRSGRQVKSRDMSAHFLEGNNRN